jgi:hypothetical protein
MLKRISFLTILLLTVAVRAVPEPQVPAPAGTPSGIIALTTGTPVRLVPMPNTARPMKCASMMVQSVAGNTAVVYVLNAPPDRTMVYGQAGTTTVAQLGIGTATVPGNSFTFPSNSTTTAASSGFDLRYWGVTGTTGDSVIATCDLLQN